MNVEKLLTTVVKAGKMLIESGAEIYRVEETMVRLCMSYPDVQIADSFVTGTGIMLSITVDDKTSTRISRVHSRNVDLNCIDKINTLSRSVCETNMSVDALANALNDIEKEEKYSFWTKLIFGAISAAGFAIFFDGNLKESVVAFFVGIVIRCVTELFGKLNMNAFFTDALASAVAVFLSVTSSRLLVGINYDVVIISSFMLLVPGLAITNAIRDTVAGDYLSGLTRGIEAFLVALAIAIGAGLMLSLLL